MTAWFRFVPHAAVDAYRALGWTPVRPAPGHHGYWSVIMRWDGPGEPSEPQP